MMKAVTIAETMTTGAMEDHGEKQAYLTVSALETFSLTFVGP